MFQAFPPQLTKGAPLRCLSLTRFLSPHSLLHSSLFLLSLFPFAFHSPQHFVFFLPFPSPITTHSALPLFGLYRLSSFKSVACLRVCVDRFIIFLLPFFQLGFVCAFQTLPSLVWSTSRDQSTETTTRKGGSFAEHHISHSLVGRRRRRRK